MIDKMRNDAEYLITHERGSTSFGELPIGARVVGPSWAWEHRTGENYSGKGIKIPVAWLVVAKDHYEDIESQVTLLAAGLIGEYCFDERKKTFGGLAVKSCWNESGMGGATLHVVCAPG